MYRYVVHVKHKNSSADYDELKVIDFYVSGTTSKITSFQTTGEAVAGSKMTMIATATPEATATTTPVATATAGAATATPEVTATVAPATGSGVTGSGATGASATGSEVQTQSVAKVLAKAFDAIRA